MKIQMRYYILFLFFVEVFAATCFAQDNQAAFYTTWKLLKAQEKQQFIAGYLQAFSDAKRITSIVRDYVKENPNKAQEGLIKIEALYDLSGLKADLLSQSIDTYYSLPENRNAPLSQAVSASGAALR